MSTKVRLSWIDIIKGICMFLIVVSHAGSPEIYTRFYTPVFLTSFFFVAGYTFNTKKDFKTFLIGKIKALLIPMIVFSTFNTIVAYYVNGDNICKRTVGVLLQRSCYDDDLWFIGCLFSILMIFYFIVKAAKKNIYIILAISVILNIIGYFYINYIYISLPWQLEIAAVMEIWFALGYIYQKYEICLKKYINTKYFLISVCVYIFIVLIYNNDVNIRLKTYQNIPIFVISSFVGIMVMVIGSQLLHSNKILEYIGRNSFIFYALQSKAIKVCSAVLRKLNVNTINYIQAVVIAIVACLIIVPCVYIINKYFPFVMGKNYRRKETTL